MWPLSRGATQRISPQTTNSAGDPRGPGPARDSNLTSQPLGSPGLTSGLGFGKEKMWATTRPQCCGLQKAHEKSCLQLLGVFSSALPTNNQHSRSWKNLTLKITECHYLPAKCRKHRAPSSARKIRGGALLSMSCFALRILVRIFI